MSAAENKKLLQDIFTELAKGNSRPFVDSLSDEVRYAILYGIDQRKIALATPPDARLALRSNHESKEVGFHGIARRIEQISQGQFALNQGTLYPALLKLEQLGWITSSWGASDNNRRARFYAISRAGRKQLKAEAEKWSRASQIVARFIDPGEDLA